MQFEKYQSLGNDFIIFDGEVALLPGFVQKLCHRRYGIGADGVISIQDQQKMRIFNADGSEAAFCLNGLRCVALYLSKKHGQHAPVITIGSKTVACQVLANKVLSYVGNIDSYSQHMIVVHGIPYEGYCVSIGNPHFLTFQSTTLDWLTQNGAFFEQHESFPNRTNVEFVTKEDSGRYTMLVFERGVGCTLACGSAAAALVGLLFKKKEISELEPISVAMPGGFFEAYVKDGSITIVAEASPVFSGIVQIS